MLQASLLRSAGTAARPGTGKLDTALITALLAVVGFVYYQPFAPESGSRASASAEAGVAAARSASLDPHSAIPVVVMPFGDRLRIAAQLVKVDDGTNIWANSYDRQLTDVFAVQEDIAHAIATSLRMPLGLKPGENLVNNRNIDSAGYQQYLRAKNLVLARGSAQVAETTTILGQLVRRSPNYAPAWAQLSANPSRRPRKFSYSLRTRSP
jgi:hypothetical protein